MLLMSVNRKSMTIVIGISLAIYVLFIWLDLFKGQSEGKPQFLSEEDFSQAPVFSTNEVLEIMGASPIENMHQQNTDEAVSSVAPIIEHYSQTLYQDSNATYISEMENSEGDYKEFVFSQSPLYKPTHEQLNSGVPGCSISGVYVDYGSTLSVVSMNNDDAYMYHYLCEYNADMDEYLVVAKPADPNILESIHSAIGNVEVIDMNVYMQGEDIPEPDVLYTRPDEPDGIEH